AAAAPGTDPVAPAPAAAPAIPAATAPATPAPQTAQAAPSPVAQVTELPAKQSNSWLIAGLVALAVVATGGVFGAGRLARIRIRR
ncbi:hypothetical protein ABZ319_08335, partial [Nocardia sp. NPDC005978]|uniref:hypothetical protein n=1 Tax=Nocardia sp. NPDC005978 TaxID=3156725 RepID=UPI0033A18320